MGVQGYTGYWGDGKTFKMVSDALDIINRDPTALLFHNFEIYHPRAFHFDTVDELTALCLFDFDGRRKVVLVDEIGMLFRADKNRTWDPALDVVFMQGRKVKCDLFWTTQAWMFLDVNVRRVTRQVTECEGRGKKRITPKGEWPVEYRPRRFVWRTHKNVNPAAPDLPAKGYERTWGFFDQRVGDSYNTKALVASAAKILGMQNPDLGKNPAIAAALGYINDSTGSLLMADASVSVLERAESPSTGGSVVPAGATVR